MIHRCAIIGAGISGLSAAYFLQAQNPDVSITVYDSRTRPGGVIKSETISGCVLEGGPDSFLTIKEGASRLCQAIGLGSELLGSNDHIRKTYIFDHGELKELPDGFFLMVPTRIRPLITTDLLSWPGKFDALSDLFSFPEQKDCSVADFIQRRFGNEVLQKIAEPMISGIYGANVNRLSLQSALPQIWQMQKQGSMILQLMRRRTEKRSAGTLFTTLKNGMESLILRLQENIQANWKFGQTVDAIERDRAGWVIGKESYDAVILAGPEFPDLDIPQRWELQSAWSSIRRNSAVVVIFGFSGVRREGFGWLVPEAERRSILACTYVSNKFPERSPENIFLVRTFIGGSQAAEWIERSDEQIRDEVLHELKRIAGIDREPELFRIFRWHHAMPEYAVDHVAKIQRIQTLIRSNAGLYCTGNIFSGVGLPDCIQHSEKIVSEMVHR
jgi:oxygen-dependent protoporphyrinogen oxidase